jgi:transcriptional regulator with XRE-family HTH domain
MADRGRAAEKLREMHADLARSESFRIELVKHEISEMIYRAIDNEGVSKAELAARLGTSRSYVTKMLQGTANFTLDSLYRIAEALNCEFRLDLIPKRDTSLWEKYRQAFASASEHMPSRLRRPHFSRKAVSRPSIRRGSVDVNFLPTPTPERKRRPRASTKGSSKATKRKKQGTH